MLFGGITASILLGMVSGGVGVKITDGLDSQHAGWLLGASLMLAGLLLWSDMCLHDKISVGNGHRPGNRNLFRFCNRVQHCNSKNSRESLR